MAKSRKKAPTTPRHPDRRPWVIGGVDYGPAMAAVADLAAWAFGLAAKDVRDWPEGRRRVKSAERFVLARMRGQFNSATPTDDVLFAAGLLARIFEADLSLRMSEMVMILDELGLPTDVVPLMPRPQGGPRVRMPSNVIPFPRRPIRNAASCVGRPLVASVRVAA